MVVKVKSEKPEATITGMERERARGVWRGMEGLVYFWGGERDGVYIIGAGRTLCIEVNT